MTPFAADQTVQHVAGTVAAASGVAAWATVAADVALAIFGVPLPVVLAAATGAAGARTFVPHVSYARAVIEGLLWGAVGVFTAQFALWIVSLFSSTIPTGALSGAALLVSAGGQIFVTPEFIEAMRAAIRRRIDGIGRQP